MFPDVNEITNGTKRRPKRRPKLVQLSQFPFNVANARTVHKLQGRSLENLMVSNWSYTTNWPYVVLSRVRTMTGLFLRSPIDFDKLNTKETVEMREKTKLFLNFFRQTKSPKTTNTTN